MSSLSPVAICNQALSWLGANRIIDLDEDSVEAKLCKANYDPLRSAVLEEHEWSFAIRRQANSTPLADSDEIKDAYDGMNRFLLADVQGVVRVLQVSGNAQFRDSDETEWYIEQNYIMTDMNKIYVRYIFDMVETGKFSAMFTQAFAARLAVELALPITESTERATAMFQLYQQKLQLAQNADGIQGKTRRIRSTWMNKSRHRSAGTTI